MSLVLRTSKQRNFKKEFFMSTTHALPVVNKISFKNILFLTDFTESSKGAMAYALGFANHFGAQVYPAHACDPIILAETAAPDILGEVEENSRRCLNELAKAKNFNGTPLFARGPIAEAVPQWIEQHGIDLIVMGTHGRHGLTHLLMGSVAEAIFRNATCPVLTVGPHVTVRPSHDFKAENILFPTDLGAHAKFATQYALSLRRKAARRLHSCTLFPWKKHSSATAQSWWQVLIRNWKRLYRPKQSSGARRKWLWKWATR
jgi:nucleotide-binding universal stress UspA family protein